MGHNPRYARWQRENWQGYAPTIGVMIRRGWTMTIHCRVCALAMHADPEVIARKKGRDWEPWGKSARCRRLHCHGRMTLRAYAPGPNYFIDI